LINCVLYQVISPFGFLKQVSISGAVLANEILERNLVGELIADVGKD
jgi:hypothetical protein